MAHADYGNTPRSGGVLRSTASVSLPVSTPEIVRSQAAPRRILHIAGRVNESVFSFLGPTLEALSRTGCQQTLVLLDGHEARRLMHNLHKRVALHPVPAQGSVWQMWRSLARTVQSVCESEPLPFEAVHLHGVLPWLLGSRLGTLLPDGAITYFSPHGSRALPWLAPLRGPIGLMLRGASRSGRLKVIVNSASEAALLRGADVEPLVVESALDPAFFTVPRHEARRPLVVSGSLLDDPRAVELFARLAVVLGAAELQMSFNWVGALSAASRTRLNAAGVGCFENTADEDLAARLASGWVYLAASGAREFPVVLAAAMAVGLPALVADEPKHRDLIRHGETGFIYRSQEEAMSLLTLLIDDAELRLKIGQAARADAAARFGDARLRQAIELAYAPPAEPPAPPTESALPPTLKGTP